MNYYQRTLEPNFYKMAAVGGDYFSPENIKGTPASARLPYLGIPIKSYGSRQLAQPALAPIVGEVAPAGSPVGVTAPSSDTRRPFTDATKWIDRNGNQYDKYGRMLSISKDIKGNWTASIAQSNPGGDSQPAPIMMPIEEMKNIDMAREGMKPGPGVLAGYRRNHQHMDVSGLISSGVKEFDPKALANPMGGNAFFTGAGDQALAAEWQAKANAAANSGNAQAFMDANREARRARGEFANQPAAAKQPMTAERANKLYQMYASAEANGKPINIPIEVRKAYEAAKEGRLPSQVQAASTVQANVAPAATAQLPKPVPAAQPSTQITNQVAPSPTRAPVTDPSTAAASARIFNQHIAGLRADKNPLNIQPATPTERANLGSRANDVYQLPAQRAAEIRKNPSDAIAAGLRNYATGPGRMPAAIYPGVKK